MKTYIQKRSKYRGIQFTGDNREKVIAALEISKDACQAWINPDTKECYIVVQAPGFNLGHIMPGEWIMWSEDKSSIRIINDELFKDTFEEISLRLVDAEVKEIK